MKAVLVCDDAPVWKCHTFFKNTKNEKTGPHVYTHYKTANSKAFEDYINTMVAKWESERETRTISTKEAVSAEMEKHESSKKREVNEKTKKAAEERLAKARKLRESGPGH